MKPSELGAISQVVTAADAAEGSLPPQIQEALGELVAQQRE
jgi:hypothetical protein